MRSRLKSFYVAHPEMSPFSPVEDLVHSGNEYIRQSGVDAAKISPGEFRSVTASPYGPAIARAYGRMEENARSAHPSYQAMQDETFRQMESLTKPVSKGGAGLSLNVSKEDPYSSPAALRHDVVENKRLTVMSTATTGGHPYFSDDANDAFRAVHDAYGHLATGRAFDRHGEEAAWLSHSRMFSPLARGAMGSETRGQNSALIYGTHENPAGEFPPQKVDLLPKALVDPYRTSVVGRRAQAFSQGRILRSV